MNPTLVVCRLGSVRIGVNWSWVIVFALIAWSLGTAGFPSQDPGLSKGVYVGMAVAAALLFFGSVLLHELGHAVEARREGMEIEGITLWLFGGVARFRGMFPSAGAEFRIAIAGPLVSLALGGAFLALAWLTHFSRAVDGVAAWLGYTNLFLLGFNLLPALPLDGGRMLRSTLWQARGDFRWATAVAADAGRAFGFLMVAAGLFLFVFQGVFTGAWLAFVGWFLLTAARAEARYVALREALAGLYVGDLMLRYPVTVRADDTIARVVDKVVGTARHTVYPVVRNAHVVGVLPLSRVALTPPDQWGSCRVDECAVGLDEVPLLREDEEALDAFTQLSGSKFQRGLVLEGGRLVGLISLTDVARVLGAARPGRRSV
jgi:Zn-dependent protease